ncbi:DinB family protein [Flavobacterium sp.]|uniref:DinB family protein n=1 Tax=Flavobacterium sp. TaxID=239 RepID=UPI0037507A81
MTKKIEQLKRTRLFLLDLIEELTPEQLNEIPEGFNNNVIWNLGHLFTGQQRVCYLRAGLETIIDDQGFSNYKPQTKPDKKIEEEEINKIKSSFVSIIDTLQTDYNKNIFLNYQLFTVPYGFDVTNIDEAINFMLFHEGLHLGYIMALKRVLK